MKKLVESLVFEHAKLVKRKGVAGDGLIIDAFRQLYNKIFAKNRNLDFLYRRTRNEEFLIKRRKTDYDLDYNEAQFSLLQEIVNRSLRSRKAPHSRNSRKRKRE